MLIAVVVGVVCSRFWAFGYDWIPYSELMGWEQSGIEESLEPTRSFSRIREETHDLDGDGAIDHWVVVMKPGEPLEGRYEATDTTNDGLRNEFTFAHPTWGTKYSLEDTDLDGVPDIQTYTASNYFEEDSIEYTYVDVNGDGMFDIMHEGVSTENKDDNKLFVFMNYEWIPVIPITPMEWKEEYVLEGADQSDKRVIFDRDRSVWLVEDAAGEPPGDESEAVVENNAD